MGMNSFDARARLESRGILLMISGWNRGGNPRLRGETHSGKDVFAGMRVDRKVEYNISYSCLKHFFGEWSWS